MITLIIKMIFLTVSWSLGWKIIISEGMLFEKIGEYAEKKIKEGNKAWDMIFCEWCIPNIHAIIFVFPLAFVLGIIPFELSLNYVFMYPFCLGGSSFITGMLWNVYLGMNARKNYFEQGAENYYLQNKEKNEK